MSLRTRKPDAPSFPVLALGPDSLHLLQRRRQCLRAGRAGQQLIVMGGALETSWSLGGASTGPLSPRSFDPTARLPSARCDGALPGKGDPEASAAPEPSRDPGAL